MNHESRLKRLRSSLLENDIDALLVSKPENRLYLSAFDGSSGYLLITSDKAVLATDFRYLEQAGRQCPDYDVFHIKGEMKAWLPELITDMDIDRLGVEAGHVTLSLYQRLSAILETARPKVAIVPIEGLLEGLRAVKEPQEVALIARAAATADSALKHIYNIIKVGMTEMEIAWELESFIRRQSGEPLAFEVMVASGPNSALPHAKPTSKAVAEGEPIVIDMGARCGGYCSDITRTVCLGRPDKTFVEVYTAVLKAQEAAIAAIMEGVSGGEADRAAREVLNRAGYADAFGHGLGHGVGLGVHEAPRLGPGSEDRLVSGMAFTIEPGVYLPDWGGVRIEDTVTIENGVLRTLTTAEKMGDLA